MENCRNCNREFEMPKNCISMLFALYCTKCIEGEIKKFTALSLQDYVNTVLKQLEGG